MKRLRWGRQVGEVDIWCVGGRSLDEQVLLRSSLYPVTLIPAVYLRYSAHVSSLLLNLVPMMGIIPSLRFTIDDELAPGVTFLLAGRSLCPLLGVPALERATVVHFPTWSVSGGLPPHVALAVVPAVQRQVLEIKRIQAELLDEIGGDEQGREEDVV